MEATRETFEAIRGTDEAAVRKRFSVLGLTPERMGPALYEEAVRDEVRRAESATASTPVVGGRRLAAPTTSSMPSMAQLRALQERNRRQATPAQLAEAEVERPQAPVRCETCGDAELVVLTRDPRDPRFGTAVPCADCVPLKRRAAWAGIPERFRGGIESFKPMPGKGAARKFAERWDLRRSVILASRAEALDAKWGTGKTHLGCAMLLRAIEAGRACRFLYVPDFLDEVKARFGDDGEQAEAYTHRMAAEEVLLLDDLGAERPTPFALDLLRSLLDRRYRASRTTVITTNFTNPDEAADVVGGATASRLRDYAWVLVGGADLRGAA